MKLNLSRMRSAGDVYVTDQCELEYEDARAEHTYIVEEDINRDSGDLSAQIEEYNLDHNISLPNKKVTITFPLIETVMEKFFLLTGGNDEDYAACIVTPPEEKDRKDVINALGPQFAVDGRDYDESVNIQDDGTVTPPEPKCNHSLNHGRVLNKDGILLATCGLCGGELGHRETVKLLLQTAGFSI